jgi:hypothetical protein
MATGTSTQTEPERRPVHLLQLPAVHAVLALTPSFV